MCGPGLARAAEGDCGPLGQDRCVWQPRSAGARARVRQTLTGNGHVVARRGFQKGSRENADTPGPPPTPSPVFGQHSEEILAAYGYSAQDIAALRERGAIG